MIVKAMIYKRVLITLSFLFLLTYNSFAFYIVGYFPTWTGNVNNIPYDKLTHINYSFILPTSSGGLSTLGNPSRLNSLVTLAHASNVKVCIAVGGWDIGDGGGNDNRFETFAADATKRTTFVVNLINFVNTYNLDGVDIDWEYPDPGTSATNFALLMKELSDSLHARSKILTAAVISRGYYGDGIKSEVFDYVDFLNLMAYDAGNPHSTYSEGYESLNYWIGRGLPPSKAILGVPFYGRNPYSSYSALVSMDPQAPNKDYVNSNGNIIYYNGLQTIRNKTNLAKTSGGGIMIWELTMDTNDQNSLLKAIHEAAPLATRDPSLSTTLSIFPNPLSGSEISIFGNPLLKSGSSLSILNMEGIELFRKEDMDFSIDQTLEIPDLNPGMYFLKISNGEISGMEKLIINKN